MLNRSKGGSTGNKGSGKDNLGLQSSKRTEKRSGGEFSATGISQERSRTKQQLTLALLTLVMVAFEVF